MNMSMADDFELNIVSEPLMSNSARKKKWGNSKEWSKDKKRKWSSKKTDGTGGSKDTAATVASKEVGASTSATQTSGKKQVQREHSSTIAITTDEPKLREQGKCNERGGRITAEDATNGSSQIMDTSSRVYGRMSQRYSIASSPGSNQSLGIGVNERPSQKGDRALKVAGSKTTLRPKHLRAKSPNESTATKAKLESALSSARPTKRKRPPDSSTKPVVFNGIIDFTTDGTESGMASNSRPHGKKHRAATKGGLLAKAQPSDHVEGAKWWDEDEDDDDTANGQCAAQAAGTHVTAKVKTATKPDRNSKVGRKGVGEVERDVDGGLPSEFHFNSVPTKAVDMDAEASNAMSILSELLGKGDGNGSGRGRELSKKVKNDGKSKKRPMEAGVEDHANVDVHDESPIEQEPNMQVEVSEAEEQEVSSKVGEVDAVADAEDGEKAGVASSGKIDGGASPNSPVGDTPATVRQEDGAEKATKLTRKTRGSDYVKGEGTNACGPLREHHARPRELSRRAASKPLASARSAHIMADGPGATFAALSMPPNMVAHLEEPKGEQGGGGMGLSSPTVCQLAAVPMLAKGHNTVIKSETGSGKTLAYLLPLLCDLATMEPRVERAKGTFAIVLAPTRELCSQILEVLTRVVRPFIWLVPGSLSGGERRKSEKARLRKGVAVLVCTPGRLLDHLKMTKCFRRDLLRWLVLDEADRLLDMGFEKQVKEIVELLDQSARAVRAGPAGASRSERGEVAPSVKVVKRQTVMVSATLNKSVSTLAAVLLSKYMRVDADASVVESVDEAGNAVLISGDRGSSQKGLVGSQASVRVGGVHGAHGGAAGGAAVLNAEEFSTPRQLVQHYMMVTQKLRLPALCAFLRAHAREKVVVFMSTCDAVDFHHALFARATWPGDESVASRGDADEANDTTKPSTLKGVADSDYLGSGCQVMRLHGNVPQAERQSTHRAFGAAKAGVLICTDVAARGLDLPTVDWIVQYDPPAETADYVHRVGRTARKGERGHSLLFLLPRETEYLRVLEARSLHLKPLSLEGVLCAADGGKRDARRADEQLAYDLQQGLQQLVAGDKTLLTRARAAFQSHVRAYAARAPDSRAVFQVRSLHLGHVARSFALQDPPTAVKVGKRVVRRPGDRGSSKQSLQASVKVETNKVGEDGDSRKRGSEGGRDQRKRRRMGGGGTGGGVRRLGLSKHTERASRAEFL